MRFLRCVLLLSLAFPCLVQAGVTKQKKAKGEATTIVYAIKSFYADYGRMPVDGATEDSREVIRVLIAENLSANPRQTVYLELEISDMDGSFPDPWGQQYVVYLDHDYDGKIAIYEESFRTPAIAQSAGLDRRLGTRDDIFSHAPPSENLSPLALPIRFENFAKRWWFVVPVVGFLAALIYGLWKRNWALILFLAIIVVVFFILFSLRPKLI